MEEQTYTTIKRTLGVLAAPITGSLSADVKDRIFGKPNCGFLDSLYRTTLTEHVADFVSMGANAAMPFALLHFAYPNQRLDEPTFLGATLATYTILKFCETGTRLIAKAMDIKHKTCGSIEGELVSRLLIEPACKGVEKLQNYFKNRE